MNAHAMISAESVTRRFGRVTAVDGVDLTVPAGEVLALLGPNGAGKTTLLDMVLGFTAPSSGTLTVLGASPRWAVVEGRVSAVLQTGGLLDDLTVAETVAFVAGCHRRHLPLHEVMARADLEPIAARKVRKCSGGEKQRLRFGLALLTDPELIILDEPTAGMDVAARASFWEAMHAEADRGRTVVFATHYLQEASDFADRIVLMRAGRIHASGTVGELTASSPRTVEATWTADEDPHAALASLGIAAEAVSRDGDRVAIALPGESDASDRVLEALLTRRWGRDVSAAAASLDEVFLALTGGTLDDDAPTPSRAAARAAA